MKKPIKVCTGGLGHPEGPYELGDGRVIYANTYASAIGVWDPKTNKAGVFADVGGGPNACMLGSDGHVYSTQTPTVGAWVAPVHRPPSIQKTSPSGKAEILVTEADGVKFDGPNDLTFGPDGKLYFTDSGDWDPAKKPQVTQAMLNFLNAAEGISSAFYAGGPSGPQFTYTLRPKLDERYAGFNMELELDGRSVTWVDKLQRPFMWPSQPESKATGAIIRLRGNIIVPVASQGSVWGIFRAFGDAEPREMNAKTVEWKYFRSGQGRREALDPPVDLDIVTFPGGRDVFNPKFWESLSCPAEAVK